MANLEDLASTVTLAIGIATYFIGVHALYLPGSVRAGFHTVTLRPS